MKQPEADKPSKKEVSFHPSCGCTLSAADGSRVYICLTHMREMSPSTGAPGEWKDQERGDLPDRLRLHAAAIERLCISHRYVSDDNLLPPQRGHCWACDASKDCTLAADYIAADNTEHTCSKGASAEDVGNTRPVGGRIGTR